jgi:hypothetical protein
MKESRARSQRSGTTGVGADSPEAPELPTGKAFVLQLSRETGPTLKPFAGRIEHLASGRRLKFESFAAFQAAVGRLLMEAKQR